MRTLFVMLFVPIVLVQGQKNNMVPYHSPLGVPMQLSANFGEIRPNHFHMGIDLKTNGKEGIPIYSIADGFVSRVKISPFGYGKAIYIDHPDGRTSVYAHCSEIKGKLGALVREMQQLEQDFEIELFLTEGKVPVERGELIAYSGNTGNSSGPHLHFEIRETKTQTALNPLCHGIDIPDNKKPEITGLKIYSLTKDGYIVPGKSKSFPLQLKGSIYQPYNPEIRLPNDFISHNGGIGFSIQTFDQFSSSGNVCGIFTSTLTIDNKTFLTLKVDSISFDHSRYVNGFKDFLEYKFNHLKYTKLFKNDINPLPVYHSPNNGILKLTPGKKTKIEITCADIRKNQSNVAFDLAVENGKNQPKKDIFPSADYFLPDSAYHLKGKNATFQVSKGTFYEPCLKKYKLDGNVFFGEPSQPMQLPIVVKLFLPKSLKNKEKCYVSVLTNGSNEHALKSFIEGDWLVARSVYCGTFTIKEDRQAPVVRPLNFSLTNNLVSTKQLRWEIIEGETQLADYDIYVNGKWQLLEYESKGSYLEYKVDPKLRGPMEVKIIATDQCGNKVTWKEILSF